MNHKKRFIIVSGPVCSGKTTLALNIAKNSGNCVYFDKDDLVRTSLATFRAVDDLLPTDADIPYERESIHMCNRHGPFFKKYIRNAEYESTRDVIIKAIQFSDLVIVNAPYTSELKKESEGDCPAFDEFRRFFDKEDVEFMVVFVHVDKNELKKRLEDREKDPVAALRDAYIYKQGIDKFLEQQNVEPPLKEGVKSRNVDNFFVFDTGDDSVRDASYDRLMKVLGIKEYAPYDRKIQVNAVSE